MQMIIIIRFPLRQEIELPVFRKLSHLNMHTSFRKISAWDLSIVYISLFLLAPSFGQSYLWVDGSATYLYGVIIALLYLTPYRCVLTQSRKGTCVRGNKICDLLKFLWMLFIGFLAGNTFENMGAALIVIVAAYQIYIKLSGIKIKLWMTGIGNILGLMMSVLSPGTQMRMNHAGGLTIVQFVKNMIFIAADYFEYFWLPIGIFAVIAVLFLSTMPDEYSLRKKLVILITAAPSSIIYLLGSLAAAFSMALSPQFPERAWSAPTILLLASLCSEIAELAPDIGFLKKQKTFVISILICAFCASYFNAFIELKSTYHYHLDRIKQIEAAIVTETDTVTIPAITSSSRYSVFGLNGDLGWDPDAWQNVSFAKYYGIGEIVRDQSDIHN